MKDKEQERDPVENPAKPDMADSERSEAIKSLVFSEEKELLEIQLPVFEGPLDLLLHLVREHRLDIFDIPIFFITSKYTGMIEKMRDLNLDVAGEFLVMAATLAHIKSRMLLPKPPAEEGFDDGEYSDPRFELVRRLLEYQKYRDAAHSLGGMDILDRDVFDRKVNAEIPPCGEGESSVRRVSVFALIEALDSVLAKAKIHARHEVTREKVSLSERLTRVVELLGKRGKMSFQELFEGDRTKQAIVITFLALLEMSRMGLARIIQDDPDSEILVISSSETDEND